MSELMNIVANLSETDEAVSHMSRALEQSPDDDVLRINAEAVTKRQKDLIRRLDYSLHESASELVRYRIVRDWSHTYPAKAVAASLTAFQELVTAIFDALKAGPKLRYHPSQESVSLSTFDFVGARAGSVIVSLSVPNEVGLFGDGNFDETLALMERALSARESDDLKLLADQIGVAAITKAYAWADASVTYGVSTQINWGKSYSDMRELTITLDEASIVKGVIENKSETVEAPETLEGILLGHDGATGYFHLETFDDKRDIRGTTSSELGKTWTTGQPYRARVIRTTQVRYSTGEEKIAWTLMALESLTPRVSDQSA